MRIFMVLNLIYMRKKNEFFPFLITSMMASRLLGREFGNFMLFAGIENAS
jgi:hypothetical protein